MLKLGFCVAQLITDADNGTANVLDFLSIFPYYYITMFCSSFKIFLILYRMLYFSSVFEKCDDTKLVIISCISKKNIQYYFELEVTYLMLKLGFCVDQLITDADNVTANVFVIAYVACVSGFSILGCAFGFL
jgi:hypothetical protein